MRRLEAGAVVIGTGISGLATALAVEERDVLLLTKSAWKSGGSSWLAQGGIAVARDRGDAPAAHAADTLAVGGGLSDPAAVAVLTGEGPARIDDLISLGAAFDRTRGGGLHYGREAGHSRHRILHAGGDRTGRAIMGALTRAVEGRSNIEILEHAFAVDVLTSGGRVCGLIVRDGEGVPVVIETPAVVLATGGIGRIYSRTTNPAEVTGDGLAMAARAGAAIRDLEFVQFHPTALASTKDPMPLLTEALRGEGAVLINEAGERFMKARHPDAELAPRDVVAVANWDELRAGRRVFLDATAAVGSDFPEKFPTVFQACMAAGIDPRTEPIPVSPAAHYHMGGIATDLAGRTSVPGLWAVGEAAATGVHGANRLASNSLLEGLVFGRRVGESVAAGPRRAPAPDPAPMRGWFDDGESVRRLREAMWHGVGIVRDARSIGRALAVIDEVEAAVGGRQGELANMVLAARLVAEAALSRVETVGAHRRSDHPAEAPEIEMIGAA